MPGYSRTYIWVEQRKSISWLGKICPRDSMYMVNKRGPKIDPCRTPQVREAQGGEASLIPKEKDLFII